MLTTEQKIDLCTHKLMQALVVLVEPNAPRSHEMDSSLNQTLKSLGDTKSFWHSCMMQLSAPSTPALPRTSHKQRQD